MRARTLKKSLPAICRAVTRQKGITLVFQGPPRTDGRTIYSNPLPIDADDDQMDIIVGDIDHECGHILYTDFDHLQKSLAKVPKDKRDLAKGVWNAIEDTAIERLLGDEYIGCRETLARSVELLEVERKTDRIADESPARVLMGYLDAWGRVKVLSQDLQQTLESACEALTCFIGPKGLRKLDALLSTRLYSVSTTQETWELAQSVVQLIEELESERDDEEEDRNDDQPRDDQHNASNGSSPEHDQGSEREQGSGSGASEAGDQAQPGNRQGGRSAADILNDSGFDTTPLFDRSQAADQASSQASQSNFVGGLNSDRISRTPDDEVEYERLKGSVSGEIRELQRRIVAEYQTRTRRRNVVSDSGRLDGRRLSRALMGDHRIYREKTKRQLPYPAVSVVLDCSGSMGGVEIEIAKQALIAVAEVNQSLGVKTELIGYEGSGVEIVKRFDEDLNKARGKIGSMRAAGGTPTAEALWEAGNRIVASKEERKLILLITDGYPNDPQGAKQVADMIAATGIELYGVGIGCDAVGTFCRYWDVIQKPEDIATSVLGALRERVFRAA